MSDLRCRQPLLPKRGKGADDVGQEGKGVTEIEKIRIDMEPEKRVEMMEKTGRRTVPQIYIDDRHIGGFDDLRALDLAGGLDPLLV